MHPIIPAQTPVYACRAQTPAPWLRIEANGALLQSPDSRWGIWDRHGQGLSEPPTDNSPGSRIHLSALLFIRAWHLYPMPRRRYLYSTFGGPRIRILLADHQFAIPPSTSSEDVVMASTSDLPPVLTPHLRGYPQGWPVTPSE